MVKVAYGVAGGVVVLQRDPFPVTTDRVGQSGELQAPSDFAPDKPQCDVVVVGASLLAEVRSATLYARGDPGSQPIKKVARGMLELGARPLFSPRSDPSDARFVERWTGDALDLESMQCAPADQRIARAERSFSVSVEVDGVPFALSAELDLSFALLTDRGVEPLSFRADTLLVDPTVRRCGVLLRCVAEVGKLDSSTLLVATRPESMATLEAGAAGTFEPIVAVDPESLLHARSRRLIHPEMPAHEDIDPMTHDPNNARLAGPGAGLGDSIRFSAKKKQRG